jgi:hypothetical protein
MLEMGEMVMITTINEEMETNKELKKKEQEQ